MSNKVIANFHGTTCNYIMITARSLLLNGKCFVKFLLFAFLVDGLSCVIGSNEVKSPWQH